LPKPLSDDEFIGFIQEIGPTALAKLTKISVRNIHARRARIEARRKIEVPAHDSRTSRKHSARLHVEIKSGTVLIGSDAHYWPGRITTAHRAFVKFIGRLKPLAVIMNGDVFDGSSISRHPPIGWEMRPSVQDEIESAQDRLGEIEKAAKGAKLIWPLGNHDARYETRLATVAPEYARVRGVHLRDHFPNWEPCWSCWINNEVVIKHRYKGGIHATHNNTLNAGKSMVTGHLHSLKVSPYSDYNGTRYGVDTGTLAAVDGEQFLDYTEDGPKNWRSGFVVLTFNDGKLLLPELCQVYGPSHVEFRGEVFKV